MAGGDTSEAVMGMPDVAALTAEAETVPAVALLHGHAPEEGAAPVELVPKGGQMGRDTLFPLLRDGTAG